MQLQLTLPDATKQCGKCHEIVPLAGFPKDRSSRDGYSWRCKACARASDRAYRQTEAGSKVHQIAKERFRRRLAGEEPIFLSRSGYVLPENDLTAAQQRKIVDRMTQRAFIAAVKRAVGCQSCRAEFDPCVLDLHHKDPTLKKSYSDRHSWRGFSTGATINELMKCCCLCANCHRKLHAGLIDGAEIPTIDRATLEAVAAF